MFRKFNALVTYSSSTAICIKAVYSRNRKYTCYLKPSGFVLLCLTSQKVCSNSETLFEQTAQIGITFDKTNGGKFYRNIFSIFLSVVGLQSIKSFNFPNLDCVIFSIPGPVMVWFINFISIPSAAFV